MKKIFLSLTMLLTFVLSAYTYSEHDPIDDISRHRVEKASMKPSQTQRGVASSKQNEKFSAEKESKIEPEELPVWPYEPGLVGPFLHD